MPCHEQLFAIYVNCIVERVADCKVFTFADGLKIVYSNKINLHSDIEVKINRDIYNLVAWAIFEQILILTNWS